MRSGNGKNCGAAQFCAAPLKAKFAATREQVYPKAIITGMAPDSQAQLNKFKLMLSAESKSPPRHFR